MNAAAPLRLIPDCGGAIARIALAMPAGLFARPDRLKLYRRLITTFGETIDVTVLCERGTAATLRDWIGGCLTRHRPRVAAGVPDGALSTRGYWLRDAALCAERAGSPVFVVPADDPAISRGRALAAFAKAEVVAAPLRLEGGNMLVGPDFRLVGCDSVMDTARAFLRGDAAAARAAIAALDGRPLHVAGFSPPGTAKAAPHPPRQPWFHLDLFLTVTGLTIAGKPVLVAAEPLATADPDGPRNPHLEARMRWLLDAFAGAFHVLRNPVPVVPLPDSGEALPRAYNNVLLQNAPALVWLPQFADVEPALARTDERNAALWSGLGFRVVPVYGWSAFVNAMGALRCASQVLARTTVRPPG